MKKIILITLSVLLISSVSVFAQTRSSNFQDAITQDTDGDAVIDAIDIFVDHNLDDAAGGQLTWVSEFENDFLLGGAVVWDGISTGDTAGDNIFRIVVTSDLGTGANSVTVGYTSNSARRIWDVDGNYVLSFANQSVLDGASPVIKKLSTIDTDNDGYVDQLKVLFSETLNNSYTPTGSNLESIFAFSDEVYDGATLSFNSYATVDVSDDQFIIDITNPDSIYGGYYTTGKVPNLDADDFNNTGLPALRDNSANANLAIHGTDYTSSTDLVGPVVQSSITSQVDSVNYIDVHFADGEIIDETSLDTTDFDVIIDGAGPANPTAYSVLADPNQNVVRLTIAGVPVDIDTTSSTAILTGTDTVEDTYGNLNKKDPVAVDIYDGISPTPTPTIAVNPIFEGSLTQTVTVTYDEAMDDATQPDISFTSTHFATNDDGAWTDGDTVWTETFTHDGTQEELTDHAAIAGGQATDVAGNPGNSADSPDFTVDTQKPTPDVTVGVDPIYEGSLTQTVTVTYDEEMNPATQPDISFTSTHFTTNDDGAWDVDNKVWTETFTHDATEEEIIPETVSVVGGTAKDVVGNTGNSGDTTFDLDTKKPIPTVAVTVDPMDLSTTLTQTVEVTYDEEINTPAGPTIDFTNSTHFTSDSDGAWTVGNTVWTENFTHDGTSEQFDPETVTAGAGSVVDIYGNESKAGNQTFVLDLKKPTPTVAISDDPISQTDLTQTVTVTFDESMDPTDNPEISFTSTHFSAGVGTWSSSNTVFTQTWTHDGFEEDIAADAAVVTAGSATDVVGNPCNTGTSNNFQIYTIKPKVTDLTALPATISDAEVGDQFTVTITYGMDMDQTSTPTLVFEPDVVGTTLTLDASSAWTSTTVYEAVYDIADADEYKANIDIIVTAATNTFGNPQEQYTATDKFVIDTAVPVVQTVTGNPSVINDAAVNAEKGQFVLSVQYNEPMNTSMNPTITFPTSTEDPSNTITPASNYWGTTTYGNDTYYVTYDLTDANENVPDIDVRVDNDVEDEAGNAPAAAQDFADVFSIDTENPEGTLAVDSDPITDNDLVQVVTITYDQAMDGESTPTISFSGNTGDIASAGDGAWSTVTLANDTWTETFDVTDADEENTVTVSSADATDANGNPEGTSVDATFDIDTKNPIGTLAVDSDLITDNDLVQVVTITYDQAMDPNPNSTPAISFSGNTGDITSADDGAWSDSKIAAQDTWTETFNVTDADEESTVTVSSADATDINGNAEGPCVDTTFEIDTKNPTPTVTVSVNPIYEGELTQTVTVTYDETMDNTTSPTLAFESDNYTQAEGGWDATDKIWTQSATHDGTLETINPATIDVTGATDAVGNPAVSGNVEYVLDTTPPTSSATSADYDPATGAIDVTWTAADAVGIAQVELYVSRNGDAYTLAGTDVTGELAGTFNYLLSPETAEGTYRFYTKATDTPGNIETDFDPANPDAVETVDITATKFNITTTPTSPTQGVTFTVNVEAVDAGGNRDLGWTGLVNFSSNYPDAVSLPDLSEFTAAANGYASYANCISNETMNDLNINVWDYPDATMFSTSAAITVQASTIAAPTNTSVADVPNDQGGWVTVDYTLSENDPFHSSFVNPAINYYVIERAPTGTTNWEVLGFIELYNPSGGDDASVLMQVPASDDVFDYQMAAVYNPSSKMFDGETKNNSPEIVYYDGKLKSRSGVQSPWSSCGDAAAKDNVEAFANFKVFLEGPYDANTGTMNNDLYTAGLLPDAPANAVDEITVELRSSATGATLKTANAYLATDGSIINESGVKSLPFFYTTGIDYYIVIQHRNHLAIMSNASYKFGDSESQTTPIDLSVLNSVYNNGFKEVETDVYAMYTGDANHNEQIQNNDKNDYWKVQVGQAGYLSADFDLNGQVQNSDKNDFWKLNVGHGSAVPTQAKNSNPNNGTEMTTQDRNSKDNVGITFSFANGVLAGGYYEFDVMAEASVAGTRLGDTETYINYNTLGFGENVVANGKIAVTKGTLLQGDMSGADLYSVVQVVDNTTSQVSVTYGYNFESAPTWANDLPATTTQLFHVKIEIADASAQAGLGFDETLMPGEQYESDNATKYSPVVATDTDNHTLPVELTTFTALYGDADNNIEINWTTASESNVQGFNLYRSQDKTTPQDKINKNLISGEGTTTEPQSYMFHDITANINSTYYYWLEVVNFNGTTNYHGPIGYTPGDTDGDGEEDMVNVTELVGNFPNPVANNATTTINYQLKGSAMDQNATIKIYNILGKLVKTIHGTGGKAVLNTSDLGQGIYFYRLQTNSYSNTKKLVIVK